MLSIMKEKLNPDCLRNVSIRQLRVLAAIARNGQLNLAAQKLSVTAPAITQQLKLLEGNAGLPLVERSKQGLRLTEAGHVLLGVHARIEAALHEGSATCAQLKGLGRGRVSVGATSTAKYLAPRIIAAFIEVHPQIDVELKVGNREEIMASLEELDFAIMGSPPAELEVEHTLIGPHPFFIVAAKDHPLAKRRRVAFKEFADETFLSRELGSGTRNLMEKTFAKFDFTPSKVTEFGSNETIKQAVMAGLGIAFISAHTVAAEAKAGWLSVLRVDGLPVTRSWYAVRSVGRCPLPASLAMWNFVGEHGEAFLPDAGISKLKRRS